ncbi:hypothetical protein FQV37_2278 [Psychrobacter nivimaris]|uniref:Uncharacterized protein n=1 Tax=Psychrobacter nivimaris TaxID=281738 RepID=A0A6N7BWK8_9GAMM|nr:hypothetical protein [Psychrobacter nivimaris]KAF0567422.1 hypothetical protein FQV37_2278 [Psychrobacter nivimaris]
MISKTLYMGEHESSLDVVVRGSGIYITDADDDETICIPHDRLQSVKDSIDSMVAEHNQLLRNKK